MDFSKINLADHQTIARQIIVEAIRQTVANRREFQMLRNRMIKLHQGKIFHNLYFVKAYEDLVRERKIAPNEALLSLIQKRRVRTMSGVAPVTVITKPWPCPGKCTYCPTDVRMPKSYLPSQPAAQRGFRQRFDPYSQMYVRLKALELEGHEVSKVELRILGGTWSSYPKKYQTWFVKRCLQAMNEYPKLSDQQKIVKKLVKTRYGQEVVNKVEVRSLSKQPVSLAQTVRENEKADIRCIGINIETRPDCVSVEEIRQLRKLGVTKVELGVQTLDDRVQDLTRRGHRTEDVIRATRFLKDAGFKIGYHMMPNLPGSTVAQDKHMIRELFINPDFQPDFLKIYPCVVIPGTSLAVQYRKGDYKPYDDATLEEVLLENLRSVPEWCRIDRVARDIPADKIEAGFKASNIRQLLEQKLESREVREIRTREIGGLSFRKEDVKLARREYAASGGKEIFLSFEDQRQDKLIALLRLRFPRQMRELRSEVERGRALRVQAERRTPCVKSVSDFTQRRAIPFSGKTFLPELKGAALIRDLHVYGKQVPVGERGAEEKQHAGWGTRLMQEAKRIARHAGFKYIAVIAGIGTREYYRKLGYRLEGTYMVKSQ